MANGFIFYSFFGIFVIIGSSNAVNLTDGLDGLATVPVMLVALSFSLICYLVGNTIFSELSTNSIHIKCWRVINFLWFYSRVLFGFLWYNAPPAKNIYG